MTETKYENGTKQTFRCPGKIKNDIVNFARENRYESTTELIIDALKKYFTLINNGESFIRLHLLAQNYENRNSKTTDGDKVTFRLAPYMKEKLENLSKEEEETVTEIILDAVALLLAPDRPRDAMGFSDADVLKMKTEIALTEMDKRYYAIVEQIKNLQQEAKNLKQQIDEVKNMFSKSEDSNTRTRK